MGLLLTFVVHLFLSLVPGFVWVRSRLISDSFRIVFNLVFKAFCDAKLIGINNLCVFRFVFELVAFKHPKNHT